MTVKKISALLDSVNLGMSSYEFRNFFLEEHPTNARQLIAVMQDIEKLHHRIGQAKAMQTELSGQAPNLALHRKLKIMKNQYDLLISWYENIDDKTKKNILENFEKEESNYWSNYLGRQAAIELLTIGKPSFDTMDKMVKLPVEDFEKTVRVCVRYANLIKESTTNVEHAMGVSSFGGLPNG
jgi:hypothetical protein